MSTDLPSGARAVKWVGGLSLLAVVALVGVLGVQQQPEDRAPMVMAEPNPTPPAPGAAVSTTPAPQPQASNPASTSSTSSRAVVAAPSTALASAERKRLSSSIRHAGTRRASPRRANRFMRRTVRCATACKAKVIRTGGEKCRWFVQTPTAERYRPHLAPPRRRFDGHYHERFVPRHRQHATVAQHPHARAGRVHHCLLPRVLAG